MVVANDETAIGIVKRIAQESLHSRSDAQPPLLEVRNLLFTNFEGLPAVPASHGDVARAALAVLAEDPLFSQSIRTMAGRSIIGDGQHKYVDTPTIAFTTAILLVLQTRLKFKLNEKRQWSIELDKGAVGNEVVKALVQRFLALLDKWNSV